ncbi:PadR family transcriptional regulator [Paenibacillus nasutitermitis]|uniref:PadR family transcriptional regulator n=1 Tax=Paenibacillus nasutitermitis TaxID=1652958 RepID=A0A916ZGX0_9BACL|nr:helix-turn-helix transcriptional regulator [Paenibacillus nasutitermitis]GGD96156.1 PadR family transcriptional regulator [Paenibacillus nasutitermitis]
MSRSNSLDNELLTDAAYYILLSLLIPRHGYGIMGYIEQLTDKEVAIGPATAYTLIKKLLGSQYIVLSDEIDNERRKTYRITEKGKRIVTDEIQRRSRMVQHGLKALQSAEEESDHE